MKRTTKSVLVFALTASMVFGNAGVSNAAKAKKPKLSKTKVTITVGKKKKITVKKAKPKKTKWSVNKKGKKIVSLSKKKKNSVTIKGKKAGKATVTAKITVGKKTYKKKVKVTVKKKGGRTTKNTPTPPTKTGGSGVTATPTPSNPSTGNPPTSNPPTSPATDDPSNPPTSGPSDYPIGPNDKKITLNADTEGGNGALDGDVTYNADGSATFTALSANSGGGVVWTLNGTEGLDLSKYSKVVYKVSANKKALADRGTPIVLQLLNDNPPVFWNPTGAAPAEYRDIEEADTPVTYEIDLDSDKIAYSALVKFNTWVPDGETYEGEEDVDITVHSIILVAKDDIPTGAPTNTATPTPETEVIRKS